MEYTILLVDDEEYIHGLLPLFLARNKKHTFTVHSAENGQAGVKMYSKLANDGSKPDLVMMDLRMPVMDGVEATKRIIEKDQQANIYLFTAYTGTETEKEAHKAGAQGTINKGADWSRIVKEIGTILDVIN
jgi:CheY-like chemotaxis protein